MRSGGRGLSFWRFAPSRMMLALAPDIASCSTIFGDGSTSAGCNLDIAFWLDPLSMIMVLIITGVGGLIHIYSTGYMHEDDVLLAVLRMAQPVHVRDAGAGAGGQHVADVRRLGGRRPVLVRADRLLVQGPREHHGGQQGVYRQSRRRLGLRDRAVHVFRRAWTRSGIRPW